MFDLEECGFWGMRMLFFSGENFCSVDRGHWDLGHLILDRAGQILRWTQDDTNADQSMALKTYPANQILRCVQDDSFGYAR